MLDDYHLKISSSGKSPTNSRKITNSGIFSNYVFQYELEDLTFYKISYVLHMLFFLIL